MPTMPVDEMDGWFRSTSAPFTMWQHVALSRRRTGSDRMRKLADWVAGLFLAALAVYLPVWWALFFSGHFALRLSPEMIALVTCFLPADAFAFATFLGFVAGLWWQRNAWIHICGFAFCGAIIYFCLFAGCAIITGAFPGDLVMHLTVWPYLIAAVVMAWRLSAHLLASRRE